MEAKVDCDWQRVGWLARPSYARKWPSLTGSEPLGAFAHGWTARRSWAGLRVTTLQNRNEIAARFWTALSAARTDKKIKREEQRGRLFRAF